MKQKTDKPISEFTEKQKEAYKLSMKATSRGKPTRRELVALIRNSGIYEVKNSSRKVVKMLVDNPEVPIQNTDGKLENQIQV